MTTPATLTLVSHKLCPYVQRAAIVLAEKAVAFERLDVDLANKPDWFLKISPLGMTPVLVVDGEAIFESAVICEFIDESSLPRLHPEDGLQRARHRAWMAFGSALLNTIAGFYNAADSVVLAAKAADIKSKFAQLEALAHGPYFAGENFSVVDAVFGPVFRYFDVFESVPAVRDFGFFESMPKVSAWRQALAKRPSVQAAVRADYEELLLAFLLERKSALSRLMAPV
jgi:glutathione S-transferase